MSIPIHIKFQINISKMAEKVRKVKLMQRVMTHVKDQKKQKSNLICIISWQIHIPNFKFLSEKAAEKSLEN